MKGLFITFEGIDGCGKTTQLARAQQHLESKSIACMVTREPGGTRIGEKIRDLLLSPQSAELCDASEVLLYFAARAQHVTEKILPAVEAGEIVLCDRFSEATFAYQGYGRGHDLDILRRFNEFATGGLAPDLTFVFDISVEAAFERMRKMNKAPDRLEQNSVAFYQRTAEGYRAQARAFPGRIALLDGELPVDELALQAAARLDALLAQKLGFR